MIAAVDKGAANPDNDGMTFYQKAVGFLWQAILFVLCFAVAMIGCLALGSEIVELIYRHEMGFSLHERLGRDLGLGIYEVMGLIPEVVIGLVVGTWFTIFVFNKIADRHERKEEAARLVVAADDDSVAAR